MRARIAIALTALFVLAAAPAQAATTYFTIRPSQGSPDRVPTHLGITPLTGAGAVKLIVPLGGEPNAFGQMWRIYAATGVSGYKIANRHSGGCLATPLTNRDYDYAEGALIEQERCLRDWAVQTWRFSIGWPPRPVSPFSPYASTNPVMIRNARTNKCLGVSSYATGTYAAQYTCTPDMRRRWRFKSFVVP